MIVDRMYATRQISEDEVLELSTHPLIEERVVL